MALHFNCPFCGHNQHYDDAPTGGFTACPSCSETLPASYVANPAGEPPLGSEAGAGSEAPTEDDAEFLHEPPTPSVMPTITGGEASLPHPRRKPSYTWLWILIGVLVVIPIGLSILIVPALNASGEAARRNACLNHMRQIGLAFSMYEYKHGKFPPAYLADADGKPMHSWRVLLLPYMEQQALYNQYNFSEPWDSEANLKVAEQIPAIYSCPSDENSSEHNHTNYMVIVGQETFFPGSGSRSSRDCIDGMQNTFLAVEVADSNVLWTQPVDLQAADMNWELNGDPARSVGSEHAGSGAMVVFADGSAMYLRKDTTAQEVEAYSTIAGGEPVERE